MIEIVDIRRRRCSPPPRPPHMHTARRPRLTPLARSLALDLLITVRPGGKARAFVACGYFCEQRKETLLTTDNVARFIHY